MNVLVQRKNQKERPRKKKRNKTRQIFLSFFHFFSLKVDAKSTVKLADLGCSRILGPRSETMTVGIGTPLWMAPEILTGTRKETKEKKLSQLIIFFRNIFLPSWYIWTRGYYLWSFKWKITRIWFRQEARYKMEIRPRKRQKRNRKTPRNKQTDPKRNK